MLIYIASKPFSVGSTYFFMTIAACFPIYLNQNFAVDLYIRSTKFPVKILPFSLIKIKIIGSKISEKFPTHFINTENYILICEKSVDNENSSQTTMQTGQCVAMEVIWKYTLFCSLSYLIRAKNHLGYLKYKTPLFYNGYLFFMGMRYSI